MSGSVVIDSKTFSITTNGGDRSQTLVCGGGSGDKVLGAGPSLVEECSSCHCQ